MGKGKNNRKRRWEEGERERKEGKEHKDEEACTVLQVDEELWEREGALGI